MSETTRSAVEQSVLRFLEQRRHELGIASLTITGGLPVFDSGLLDSLSLIDLVAAVEAGTHQTIDMLRFDPSAVDTADELVNELAAALSV